MASPNVTHRARPIALPSIPPTVEVILAGILTSGLSWVAEQAAGETIAWIVAIALVAAYVVRVVRRP